MTRMRQEDGIKIDYEVGRALVVMLGAFRPVLGAIFGTATFFALESGVFQPTPDTDATAFFYYPLFAFAAGFSERYAHVIMGDADLSVARALTGAETSEQADSDGRPRGLCRRVDRLRRVGRRRIERKPLTTVGGANRRVSPRSPRLPEGYLLPDTCVTGEGTQV